LRRGFFRRRIVVEQIERRSRTEAKGLVNALFRTFHADRVIRYEAAG
jgi:hypothetical protein